ncbi:MAG: hypothetical protein EPN93_17425 [Spirochaetes bacterium]|nr:MAG: hypothetical protein EPN93_17425 [Spirochaetota bacterium]
MKGYGLPKETYIELLTDRIEYFGRQLPDEDFQIMDMRYAYDEEGYEVTGELVTLDEKIIRIAKELGAIESDNGEEHWIWNLDAVARGAYPIEKLPTHVRDLAKELYYDRAA